MFFQSQWISDFVLRVIPDVYCQLRNELSNCGVFRNFKGVYVEQTTFLENGNITPQAQAFLVRFEI